MAPGHWEEWLLTEVPTGFLLPLDQFNLDTDSSLVFQDGKLFLEGPVPS